MKYLFSIISQNGEQFVKHFQEQDKDVVTVEMRDVITKFTNDVIANSVFGFDCNSLKEPNNEFYVRGKEATDFKSFRKIFVFMGSILIPQLIKVGNSFIEKLYLNNKFDSSSKYHFSLKR
jgi:cytochrome P450 family 9